MAQRQDKAWKRLSDRYRFVDGRMLLMLTEASMTWLQTNQDTVNALNVYPVPDGDTGTNMLLTMQNAVKEVEDVGDRSIGKALQALAHGALMGARGNSGVILSQIWRGFARALEGVDEMDAPAFVRGLARARDTAYRGVGNPVEGTILTVSKDIAEAAEKALADGAISNLDVLDQVVKAADASVENTPNLLEVLAKAGVVDAGGKGLFFILEGMLRAAQGMDLDVPLVTIEVDRDRIGSVEADIEEGQDWEVVVDFRPREGFELRPFTKDLADMGTSIQIAEGDGLLRMHIHVPDETEYAPIDYCKQMGTITNVHIENLMDQMDQILHTGRVELAPIEAGQLGVVAIASGAGLAKVLADMGVAALIEGGQTMNPSAEEILTAIDDLPTDHVIVLPNNKNIIMAAEQAAGASKKQVEVVATRTLPQGIAAMLSLNPDGDLVDTAAQMRAALADVQSGEITRAVRSVTIDEVDVEEGQIIALLDDSLVVATDDLLEAAIVLLEKAHANDAELITLYWGADLPEQEAIEISEQVASKFSSQEVELVHGGQPHYDLICSVE